MPFHLFQNHSYLRYKKKNKQCISQLYIETWMILLPACLNVCLNLHSGASLPHTCAAHPSTHRSLQTRGMQLIWMFDICTWFLFTTSCKSSNPLCGDPTLSQVDFNLRHIEDSRDKRKDWTLQHVINLCLWLKFGGRGGICRQNVRLFICWGLAESLPCTVDYYLVRFITITAQFCFG